MENKWEKGLPSPAHLRGWLDAAREKQKYAYPRGSASVLAPVLIRDGAYALLFEVRACGLRTQPGEICFPGGRIEKGESPMEAAVREAAEELLLDRGQIEVVGAIEEARGPGGAPLFSYVGILHGYGGTWSRTEVDHVFTVPLQWFLEHDPEIYRVELARRMPEDFPYQYVPGGESYHWRETDYPIPFYPGLPGVPGTDPVLWGATARVTWALARLLRSTGPAQTAARLARV